jgi:hypothetical protein
MEEQIEKKGDAGGRPTKYRKEFTNTAYQLALLGATDDQLAEAFDVNVDTIHEWKKKHKGFSDSLRRGKLKADGQVAQGLFRRATGFKYNEVTFEKIDAKEVLMATTDGDLMRDDIYRKKVVTKYVPPDPGAAMGWLKNRQSQTWRDKQTLGLEFEQMTDEQLDKVLDKLTQAVLNQANNGK